ncbi:23S rRNA (adenine(2503)-C(2))-methyltransferase RlmN [bacterium]|nr:23S rRNA (adenine(2503)-C(2))-methyltransferase RlmN [bacterium]
MNTEKTDITGLSRAKLGEYLSTNFQVPAYRSRQMIQWIHRQRVTDFDAMTDFSKKLREELKEKCLISRPEKAEVLLSKDGSRKYLFKLTDGMQVESVFIKQEKRNTLCISSQVGCAIGCRFCMTGTMGLTRNLTAAEIIGQVLAVQDDVVERGDDPERDSFSNIVFMGMGEPLHNVENVFEAARLLNDNLGHNFSSRKVTISTSGLVPAIDRFGEENIPANLAISLNATTDEVREKLIPINKKWPLETLLGALRRFPLKAGKRITIEYVLLKDVNDTDADLKRLPGLLRDIPSKINLIPYNENTGLGFYPPDRDRIGLWQETLLSKGMNATIRWSKGQDIAAACGQLVTESSRKKKLDIVQ